MRRVWRISLVAGGLAVAAGVLITTSGITNRVRGAGSNSAAATDATYPVRVYRVAPATPTARTYTGVVKPRYETDLGFRVAGKVIERKVEVGERVRAGQVIAQLDRTDYELSVKIAEAEFASAKSEADNAAREDARYRSFNTSLAVSKSDRDRVADAHVAAVARKDRSERSLALARNRLNYCTLTADADGVVTALPVEVGQVVAEGVPVARIARTGEFEAVVAFPENRSDDAKAVSRLTVWGSTGAGYDVKLRELSPTADATTRTYQARFTIEKPGTDVTLGRTVTLHFGATAAQTTVKVPLTAVGQQNGRPIVWRIEHDRLIAVPVKVAEYREEEAVIAEGVRPGDMIVASGTQKLDAGMRVRPWEGK